MAGILNFLGLDDAPQGGILGTGTQSPWQSKLGMFSAGLSDAGAALNGRDTNSIGEFQSLLRKQQLRDAYAKAATATDPALRQQAYSAILAAGGDPTALQHSQAQTALPQLLSNLQPSMGFNDNPVGVTPAVNAAGPGVDAARTAALQTNAAPSMSMQPATFSGALQRTGSPELTAEMAPQIVQTMMRQQQEAVRPATVQEKLAVGLDAKTPAQVEVATGKVSPISDPNALTAYQTQSLAQQDRELRERQAHDRALESQAGDSNPFGKGRDGKAYAILSKGLKDPSVRGTPEYLTAWQILSNPKVDPNTGTIVRPDMSAFPPPAGIGGQGGNAGARTPSIEAFAPPNPKQGEAASAGYANRLAESAALIDQSQGALSSLGQNMKSHVPVIGNYLVSGEFQKGDQAERNFINAQLRRESGAAIAESEFANARKQYIPQPGDGPEVLAQKKAARDMAVRNMQLSAGNTLLPPGVNQMASPPRGAPMVPQQQGFGTPPVNPANLPRIGGKKTIRFEDLP